MSLPLPYKSTWQAMSDLTCIIIEDEPLAAKVLTDYISQVPFLRLQGTFKDAILATDHLRTNPTDLIFLDIHLPKLKGMAFLKMLSQPPAVIVTTAYHQYAVEGYSLNVTDYLLKPFDFERFLAAVTKVKTAHHQPTVSDGREASKDHLFLTVQKKKVKVMYADIVYVESQREYVRIVTVKGAYLSKMSTQEIEALLPVSAFRRIHRSFIVSLARIDSYTADEVDMNGTSIPIGRGYRDVIDDL
jgi:two-component system LytT family response regulator